MNQNLHFILASDEKYSDKLGVTLYSLLEKHKLYNTIIHILSNKISDSSLTKIHNIANGFSSSKLVIHDFNDLNLMIQKEVNVDHLSLAAYARLFIPNILDESVKKALYLDVDILVNDDLSTLFKLDLESNLIAGVRSIIDLSTSFDQKHLFHINSGVIIWNLVECRKFSFVEKSMEYIKSTKSTLKFHDQTVINEICKGRIFELDLKYNVMSGMFFLNYKKFSAIFGLIEFYNESIYKTATSSPAIVHLTSWVVGRPWEKKCSHPFKKDYLSIKAKTPFASLPLLDNKKSNRNWIKLFMFKFFPACLIRYIKKNRMKGIN
jgi:lipopolysaccharide biosynthesis glycosyltransferase